MELEVAELRRQDEHNRNVVLAWHGVAIYVDAMNRGRLQDVRGWLSEGPGSAPRPQTAKQHRAVLELLSAQHGIPLRKGGKDS
jgi:butyrate kinase